MRASATALVVAAAVSAFAPAAARAESMSFDLTGFTQIDISTGIEASVTVGAEHSVVAEAARDDLDDLVVRMEGTRLHAYIDRSVFNFFDIFGHGAVQLTITMPALDAAEATSGASVSITGARAELLRLDASSGADMEATEVGAGRVEVDLSSGASVRAAGVCEALVVDASSGANLKAGALNCGTAQVEASSGGRAEVFATEVVSAKASSGGYVGVIGNPARIDRSESSGGRIVVLD